MAPRRGPSDLIRTLAASLTPTRLPADVIGYLNGLLQVHVDGRVVIVEYAGTDELLAGYKIWVTRNNDDPHGSYAYAGLRLESGTIHFSPPQTRGNVAEESISKYLLSRIVSGLSTYARRYLEFVGDVTITDDAVHNKIVVTIGEALSIQTINFVIDGGGADIAPGLKGYFYTDYSFDIIGVTLLADTIGDFEADVWVKDYAASPPLLADSIVASTPPTLTSAQKSQDTTLTGWATAIVAGDVLAIAVTSATTVTRVTLALAIRRV